jgi:hypothetical protein
MTQLNIKIKKLLISNMQEIEKEVFLHTIKDINYFFNLKKKIKTNPLIRLFNCKKKTKKHVETLY